MHTLQVPGGHVHHNSDWSGDVIIALEGKPELRVPGVVLKHISAFVAESALNAEACDMADRIRVRLLPK